MPTRNVNLTDELTASSPKKLDWTLRKRPSEVVRAGLRTLERENSSTKRSLPRCERPSRRRRQRRRRG